MCQMCLCFLFKKLWHLAAQVLKCSHLMLLILICLDALSRTSFLWDYKNILEAPDFLLYPTYIYLCIHYKEIPKYQCDWHSIFLSNSTNITTKYYFRYFYEVYRIDANTRADYNGTHLGTMLCSSNKTKHKFSRVIIFPKKCPKSYIYTWFGNL